jgi:hypothetical protein
MQRIDRILAVSAVALATLIVCFAVANGRVWVHRAGVAVSGIALVIVVATTRRMR